MTSWFCLYVGTFAYSCFTCRFLEINVGCYRISFHMGSQCYKPGRDMWGEGGEAEMRQRGKWIRDGGVWGGCGGGFSGTQTADCPKLRWSFTLRHRAAVSPLLLLPPPVSYHRPPASPRITPRHQRAGTTSTERRRHQPPSPAPCATVLHPVRHLQCPAGGREQAAHRAHTHTLATRGFVVVTRRESGEWERYQERAPGPAAPALRRPPVAWMRHGHVCVPGSVFRRHRSVQQHQLPRAHQTASVHLQGGHPPHQPVSRGPPAPQSPAQGRTCPTPHSVPSNTHFTLIWTPEHFIYGRELTILRETKHSLIKWENPLEPDSVCTCLDRSGWEEIQGEDRGERICHIYPSYRF